MLISEKQILYLLHLVRNYIDLPITISESDIEHRQIAARLLEEIYRQQSNKLIETSETKEPKND